MTSAMSMSDSLPVDTMRLRPMPCTCAMNDSCPASAPLCDTMPSVPAGSGSRSEAVHTAERSTKLTKPRQLGPRMRRPRDRALAVSWRWRSRPSSPASAKPELSSTALPMPARCRSASASSSASAGTMSSAVSTGSPMASAEVAAAMP
ncbi:hypothetical protein D3C72_1325190 [compost metagenome]